MLEVPVPLKLLLEMLNLGLDSLTNPNRAKEPYASIRTITTHGAADDSEDKDKLKVPDPDLNDEEVNLCCYILMLDILIKQQELQEIAAHKGLEAKEAKPVFELLTKILNAEWIGKHTCTESHPDSPGFNDGKEGGILV